MVMPRRRRATNGEGDDGAALQEWMRELRATLLGPARAIYRHLASDGRPAEEALRAMAERAGVAAEDALPLLEWGPRLREAAEQLEDALAHDSDAGSEEEDRLSDAVRQMVREFLDELRDALALLHDLEARVGKSDTVTEVDPAAEREVDSIVAGFGVSREAARDYLRTRNWAALEAARGED